MAHKPLRHDLCKDLVGIMDTLATGKGARNGAAASSTPVSWIGENDLEGTTNV